jgi:hypothetical protein
MKAKTKRRKERQESKAVALNTINSMVRLGLAEDLGNGEYKLLKSKEEAEIIIKKYTEGRNGKKI